ncbi:iron-containing alcohol dehydrogenase [Salicibibacter cibi]|uniref:Iron-containing alcohol dehydrogenase n=1 Tax=Salicibibacter cibi TaxID=2743001 RepID=A0A7T6ZC07_9BACI|nr:iron-containing alcohol dehydrogenase [Salicibibacter cibi]QQK80515.1 iron-containing alcohol dehydrogenase [Salicibibacter cibi]
MSHSFVSPLKLVTGEGGIRKVPSLIHSFNAKKVMVYADPGVIDAGVVQKLETHLQGQGIEYQVYSELVPEPPLDIGNKALQAVKAFDADLVIGIGGGSSLDIAKAAAVLKDHDGNVEDYLNLSGTKSIKAKGLPKILIPTTSGTGAEVTDIAVFSLENTKDVLTHEHLIADVAVVDPELTYTVPPKITAATGVDALTHAVESLTSVNATPLTDALALDAIERISSSIRTAVWNGGNIEARSNMAWGSMIAGLSFYNAGVAGVHALAYPLGGIYKIPHGEANAVLLPYIYDYIWPSCIDKMTVMAEKLGVTTESMSKREATIAAVRELRNIVKDVGIPSKLQSFGVKEDDLDLLAEEGIKQKRLLDRSPMPFTQNDIRDRYRAAFEGELKFGE